ncbi:metal-sensitive transcriptional regulator [Crassaminicella thermophila]|nr:metal-sensitive transcriptional regulator [Crassaminicella thermophila]
MKEGMIFMAREDAKKDIINRLRTIKGHIAGIEKMIEEDTKTCEDILLQIAAIRASVHKVGLIILEEHAKDCLIGDKESLSKEEVENVLKTIVKFVK